MGNPLSNLESIISGTRDSIKNFVHWGSILFFQNSSSLNILSTTKPIKKSLLIMFIWNKNKEKILVTFGRPHYKIT